MLWLRAGSPTHPPVLWPTSRTLQSQMQHMMKAMGQKDLPEIKPILEVNPDHEIVKKLAARKDDKALVEDIALLLLEQAMMVEGVELKEPAAFVKRLNRIMGMAL